MTEALLPSPSPEDPLPGALAPAREATEPELQHATPSSEPEPRVEPPTTEPELQQASLVTEPEPRLEPPVAEPVLLARASLAPTGEPTPPATEPLPVTGSTTAAPGDLDTATMPTVAHAHERTPFGHLGGESGARGGAVTGEVPVIDLVDAVKVYSTGSLSVQALRGVTIRVDPGEHVAIMGPSGSGKSTLMHILGCLDVLSEGRYHLAGQDVSAMTEVQLAEVRNRRIGFVFQQFNLLASLSAWRNVELPLIYGGVARAERRRRSMEALERVGLEDRMEHRPGELSGGQQQRVAVARALVTDPDLVLADEPTGNLDSSSTEDILGLLAEVHDQGRTVVLITHEFDVARSAARMIRMRDGLVHEDGSMAGALR